MTLPRSALDIRAATTGERTGLVDTGLIDTGLVDTGLVDTGLVDTGLVDLWTGCALIVPRNDPTRATAPRIVLGKRLG